MPSLLRIINCPYSSTLTETESEPMSVSQTQSPLDKLGGLPLAYRTSTSYDIATVPVSGFRTAHFFARRRFNLCLGAAQCVR